MGDSFPERLAQAAIEYHETPPPFGALADVAVISRTRTSHYRHDPERDGYWVQAEVFVPRDQVDPGASTTYIVWMAEQETLGFPPGGTYPGPWVWRSDASFCCDVIDPAFELEAANASARQQAHEHARYLRNTYPCAYVAVRDADRGQPLPIRDDPDA